MARYFSVTVLIAVPDEHANQWDCGCDETFSIAHIIDGGVHNKLNADIAVSEYHTITSDEFTSNRHNVFNADGGI